MNPTTEQIIEQLEDIVKKQRTYADIQKEIYCELRARFAVLEQQLKNYELQQECKNYKLQQQNKNDDRIKAIDFRLAVERARLNEILDHCNTLNIFQDKNIRVEIKSGFCKNEFKSLREKITSIDLLTAKLEVEKRQLTEIKNGENKNA